MASLIVYFPTTLLVILFALTTTLASSKPRVDGDLVSSTCKKTLYVKLCVSSLSSDPRSKTADLRGLAAIALNRSIAKGVETRAYIDNLRSESASSAGSQAIDDCAAVYSDAVESLQDSAQALNDMSYDTVRSLVSSAMTDSETCEEGFAEIEGKRSPLAKRNQYFSRLCSNFLAITTLLY